MFKSLAKWAALAALPLVAAHSALADDVNLERSMLWSAYDVGSSGYTEASMIADALMKEYGVRIRIMPSGTAIGRLKPLETGRVKFAFLATETYFAAEGIYDFASPDWGPQDLRVLLGRPASVSLATAADANIKTLEDLRGKRVAYVEANPSVNIKAEALMASAGLTWDDVQQVRLPSYGASLRGMIEDTVDAAIVSPGAPTLYELESSPRGLAWPNIPLDDKDAWDRLNKVAPIFEAAMETVGAGMSEDKPAPMAAYRYPMIVTYAALTDDEAYNMTKAVVSTYDLYKDSNPVMPRWDVKLSGRPPVDAPFHPGAIRYLKEIGVWTAEDDKWNQKRIEHLRKVKAAWEAARDEAKTKGISDDAWPQFWMDYRKEALSAG